MRSDQHFTGSRVADLVCAFCLRSGSDAVLDPSCGNGAFLARAGARLRFLGGSEPALHGVEIDPALAAASRVALPEASIVTGDFLAAPARAAGASARAGAGADARRRASAASLLQGSLDAVVGNPPYVRQERLGRRLKRRLTAAAATPAGPALSRRSDLHVYFWRRAMDLLRPGGRLGFLTSGSWLDAAYGDALREWLTQSFRLVALIESETESWFDDARVRTVITIVEKSQPDPATPARLARLSFRLDELAPSGLPEQERLARFESLAQEIESGRPERTGLRVRPIHLDGLTRWSWGPLLRQPALWFEILERAGDKLVPLSEVAGVRWGIKTGDDKFFFLRPGDERGIDPRHHAPAVFSLMELDRLVVTEDQLRRRLLLIDRRDGPIDDAGLLRRIRHAQRERATHRRPTCAARVRRGAEPRSWYELRPGPSGRILWSIMHQYRHLAPLNPHGFPANDNLLLIDPLPGIDARLLAALLNTHLQALLKLAHGRQRNEGMLKTQAGDVKRMLVPDPRLLGRRSIRGLLAAFDRIAQRPIGGIAEECARADRRRLDLELMRALGFPHSECNALVVRLYATLMRFHNAERTWEIDAVSRRARGRRLRREDPGSASATAG